MSARMESGLTLYNAEDEGLDPDGGKWVVACDTHGCLVNVRTKSSAYTVTGTDFCEGCREDEEPEEPCCYGWLTSGHFDHEVDCHKRATRTGL